MLGVLIALSWISVSIAARWHISFAWIVVIALLVYYFFLSVKLAAVMTVILVLITALCTWVAFPAPTATSLILFLILFIGGCLLRCVGHTFEKTKVDYLTYLKFAAVTPLYVVVELILALGWKKYFHLEKHLQPPTSKTSPPHPPAV